MWKQIYIVTSGTALTKFQKENLIKNSWILTYFEFYLFDRVREEYDAQTFKRGKDCVIYLSQDKFIENEV